MSIISKPTTTESRFWSKVSKTDKCWVWKGGKINGYGAFTIDRKSILAHQYSYLLAHNIKSTRNNPIDHLCRNRACVNPDHLEQTTTRENISRGNIHTKRKYNLPLGVHKANNKYAVHKRFKNDFYYLGVYDTPEEASIIYQTASI